eukprot:scaffold4273_cov215-Pinguiococcus_pyrenoidosus.AAC.3
MVLGGGKKRPIRAERRSPEIQEERHYPRAGRGLVFHVAVVVALVELAFLVLQDLEAFVVALGNAGDVLDFLGHALDQRHARALLHTPCIRAGPRLAHHLLSLAHVV